MESCAFCQIIAGKIPAHKVYEDNRVLAFLDIHPQQPGHTLVVPKTHVDPVWDMAKDEYHNLWQTAQKIALHMGPITGKRIGVHVEGTGVPHTHVHLVPFTTTEEFLRHPDMSAEPDHDALAKIAEHLHLD